MSQKTLHDRTEEMKRALLKYEEHHAVDEYILNGWHVWPILRMWIREQVVRPYAFEKDSGKKQHEFRKVLARRSVSYIKLFLSRLNPYFDQEDISPDSSKTDVVILTHSNRRQKLNGKWIHYLADTLIDELDKTGVDARVWELGNPPFPCYRPSSRIETRLDFAVRIWRKFQKGSQLKSEPPEWFIDLSNWTAKNLEWKFEWSKAKGLIEKTVDESCVIERWLRRAGCKCVFVDPWYSWTSMSASLACSRLDIPSIDLQHGMQGRTHLCYANWKKVPEQGYEVVPDYFWFWGREDAQSFEANNNHFSIPIIGGSIWLNWWREEYSFESEVARAKNITRGSDRAILVTLQPEIDLDLVYDAVRKSDVGCCWLIRLHRDSTVQLEQLSQRFKALGRSNIIVEEATQLPLYALFQAVGAHVTGFSTCALEALAFGVPTVVTHQRAQEAYGKYIDGRVMLWAEKSEEILRKSERARDVSSERCRRWADTIFASSEKSVEAIQRIARYCSGEG